MLQNVMTCYDLTIYAEPDIHYICTMPSYLTPPPANRVNFSQELQQAIAILQRQQASPELIRQFVALAFAKQVEQSITAHIESSLSKSFDFVNR